MYTNILKIFVALFLSCSIYGQNFKLNYQLTYKEDSLSPETTNKNMILLVQGGVSKFLTEKQFKLDSIRSKGFEDFGIGDNSFLIVNHKENLSNKYYFLFKDIYRVTEKVDLKWELSPETKKIANYLCTKAILKYKGRTWEAWFTQELPINGGPYIFQNLPGVIIQMEDTTGSYKFSLYSIQKIFEVLDLENMYNKAINISQKQVQKVFIDYYNDPFRELKSANTKTKVKDENGKDIELNFKKMTETVQSRLIKNNNPIELSEAIKY